MGSLLGEITILIHKNIFYKYLELRFCFRFIWFLHEVLLKDGSQFLKKNCRKFWTRNRPGDRMRDRYNLNTLPGGSEHELAEFGTDLLSLSFFGVWETVSCTISSIYIFWCFFIIKIWFSPILFITVNVRSGKQRVKTYDKKAIV